MTGCIVVCKIGRHHGVSLTDRWCCLVERTALLRDLSRNSLVPSRQIQSLAKCFVSVQPAIIWRVHINGEGSKHFVNSLFEQFLVNVIIHCFKVIEKCNYPFLRRQIKAVRPADNDYKKMPTYQVRICQGLSIDKWGLPFAAILLIRIALCGVD